MSGPDQQPSALHVNDAAFTAARLLGEARSRGLRWDLLPIVAPGRDWSGPLGTARKAALGAPWLGRLALGARRHDIVHVHSATTLRHTRPATRRYVLHCHGSDVRTAQYEPANRTSIQRGLSEAEAVFFSTPDLAEHILPRRPDAHYLPVPVAVDDVPVWAPSPARPTVVFASRWSPEKNSSRQLAVAGELVRALGDRADVIGLDWGPQASAAAALGVRLVPRTEHAGYLRLLAGAHVVVGQSGGILAASELEALSTRRPAPRCPSLPLYAGSSLPVPSVDGTEAAVAAVRSLLDDPGDPARRREWVRSQHGVVRAVDAVTAVYGEVMAARR